MFSDNCWTMEESTLYYTYTLGFKQLLAAKIHVRQSFKRDWIMEESTVLHIQILF